MPFWIPISPSILSERSSWTNCNLSLHDKGQCAQCFTMILHQSLRLFLPMSLRNIQASSPWLRQYWQLLSCHRQQESQLRAREFMGQTFKASILLVRSSSLVLLWVLDMRSCHFNSCLWRWVLTSFSCCILSCWLIFHCFTSLTRSNRVSGLTFSCKDYTAFVHNH